MQFIISVNIFEYLRLNLYNYITRLFFYCFSYFLGIPEGKPGQQHLYRVTSVPPRTGAILPPPVCLTCVPDPVPTTPPYLNLDDNMYIVKTREVWEDDDEDAVMTTPPPRRKKSKKVKTPPSEPPCLYHNVIFSPNSGYYVLECLGPGMYIQFIYKYIQFILDFCSSEFFEFLRLTEFKNILCFIVTNNNSWIFAAINCQYFKFIFSFYIFKGHKNKQHSISCKMFISIKAIL